MNSPTPQRPHTGQQLFLLELCRRLPDQTREDLLQLMVDSCYFNYLSAAELLTELYERNLLFVRQDAPFSRYSLSPSGEEVLDTLGSQLPPSMGAYLDELLPKWKAEKNHLAKLIPWDNGRFLVELAEYEQEAPLFELRLAVPSESIGRCLVQYFNEAPSTVFALLHHQLLANAIRHQELHAMQAPPESEPKRCSGLASESTQNEERPRAPLKDFSVDDEF